MTYPIVLRDNTTPGLPFTGSTGSTMFAAAGGRAAIPVIRRGGRIVYRAVRDGTIFEGVKAAAGRAWRWANKARVGTGRHRRYPVHRPGPSQE